MKRLFVALPLFAALIAGCAQPKAEIKPEKPKPLPAWYLTPPAGDAQWLYGAGSGKTRDEAVQEALDNLLAQLSVTVESSLQIHTQVSQGATAAYTQSGSRQIRSEVAKIRVPGYQVAAAETLGYNRFAALVKSDRKTFAEGLQSDIDDRFARIDAALQARQNASALHRYGALKTASAQADETRTSLAVLQTLQPGFDAQSYQSRINALHAQKEQLRQNLSFTIQSDGHGAQMAGPIKTGLSAEGFALRPAAENRAEALTLQINAEVIRSKASGIEIADTVLTLETRDFQGQTVASARRVYKTGAAQGTQIAVENAAKALQRQIAQEGIAAVLGLDL